VVPEVSAVAGPDWRTDLLVVQPTPFCNINCSYCYLPHREDKQRLTPELAERIFERVLAYPTMRDGVTVVWHAGEPMVLPPSYYAEMFRLVDRIAKARRIEVTHSFQTNATLVTDEWCAFIKEWRPNVGVSIDGPADIHDRHRRYRNGSGSFAKAYAGLKRLLDQDIPVHMISVLTLASLREPERMFEFYEQSGVHTVCFNIEEKEGANLSSELIARPAEFVALYRAFLERLFALAVERRSPLSVREFDNAFRAIQGYHADGHVNFQTNPLGIVAVDTTGNLSTFSPELLGAEHPAYGSFTYGNVLSDNYETIVGRVLDSRLYADINAGIGKCRAECSYFMVCGGGAPANKIFENNTANSSETVYCRAHQTDIDVVLDMIERIPAETLDKLRAPAAPNMRRF
jgi:uncharacterized protein